jgi:hypothetical protein
MMVCLRCRAPVAYVFAVCRRQCRCRTWATDEQIARAVN